jgi:hypothetical protein
MSRTDRVPEPVFLDPATARLCSERAWARTCEVVAGLDAAGNLDAPTLLSGWPRLTVTCHLRYGARASRRVTTETLEGFETSFYPGGRSLVRPPTLLPEPGESPSEVLRSLESESRLLHEVWSGLTESEWRGQLREPADNPDLGSLGLGVMVLLRLTEVEVHGTDLDLGLSGWSDLFIETALPIRLAMLGTRPRNPTLVDPEVQGAWLIVATDGPSWLVSVRGDRASSEAATSSSVADALIEASSLDLLAMLLGRPHNPLSFRGDLALARSFKRAFPGP